MKLILIIFSIALMLMVENSMAQDEQVIRPNLIDIIQGILNDPEYKALSYEQQLNVLIMLYNYLASLHKAKNDITKRDVDSSMTTNRHRLFGKGFKASF